jgi:hypothetical protein
MPRTRTQNLTDSGVDFIYNEVAIGGGASECGNVVAKDPATVTAGGLFSGVGWEGFGGWGGRLLGGRGNGTAVRGWGHVGLLLRGCTE